jgi:hypothetical protein
VAARAAAAAQGSALHRAAATVYLNDAADRVEIAARSALAAMLDGSELKGAVEHVRRLFDREPVRTSPLRDQLAAALLSQGRYPFA